MFRQLAILLSSAMVLSAMALMGPGAQAETLNVHLMLSDNTPPYRQFTTALERALAANKDKVKIVESQADASFPQDSGTKIDLIVTVGTKAAEIAISKLDAPVLCVLIPRLSYETLLEKRPLPHPQMSAIYLDQPWDRQLNFIHAALPRHNTVGMLYSPETPIVLPRLPQGMSLNAKSVRSANKLFDALESILSSSDVLLVVPDSEIYSANNVRNILLTSYRYKVPLIGISQAYVNAGALGAIFSTPEQLADQTGTLIVSFADHRQLPEPQHPASFTVALNQQVARSLGITLNTPAAIRESMDKVGGEGR